MLKEENSKAMMDSLDSYARILDSCEKQMHSLPPQSKRPNFKKQEIELRQQLKTLNDLMARSDLDDRPAIQDVIRAATLLRTHFLASFFGKESLKQP